MISSTCPVCGGKLNIRVDSDLAECGSCGNVTECDPSEMAKIRAVYRAAERSARMNTASGYREAISKLKAIPFVADAAQLTEQCERRLSELSKEQAEREQRERESGKKSAVIGIVLLVVALILCAAAVAGAVYLVYRLVNGTLPLPALPVVIVLALLAAVIFLVGKSR